MTLFSKRGQGITDFEQLLLIRARADRPEAISDLWVGLSRRMGGDRLVVLFDELGGEKVHIPTREEFFADLYRPERNRAILDRLARRVSMAEICAEFGIDPRTVRRVRREALGTTCPAEVC